MAQPLIGRVAALARSHQKAEEALALGVGEWLGNERPAAFVRALADRAHYAPQHARARQQHLGGDQMINGAIEQHPVGLGADPRRAWSQSITSACTAGSAHSRSPYSRRISA